MSLAILCSGQGGQHQEMFDLLASIDEGEDALARAGAVVGFDLRAPLGRIFDNAIAQPTICALALATWSLLESRLAATGIAARCFAGYSVGELAAHGCAGALTHDDTLRLAQARALAMDTVSAPGDGLVAVSGFTVVEVEAIAARSAVHVAIVNGDDRVVVGGSGSGLEAFTFAVAKRSGQTLRLPVAVAAHTPLLAGAVGPFRSCLAGVRWTPAAAPVLAGLDGSVAGDSTTAIDVLARQIATTIRWSTCMDSLRERGATVCLELGPGDALARMMRERHADVATRSVSDFRTIDGVIDWILRALS